MEQIAGRREEIEAGRWWWSKETSFDKKKRKKNENPKTQKRERPTGEELARKAPVFQFFVGRGDRVFIIRFQDKFWIFFFPIVLGEK